jgi:hypothetical protein
MAFKRQRNKTKCDLTLKGQQKAKHFRQLIDNKI